MTLTSAAMDYIANHFGSGTPKCFVSSGISYTDPMGVYLTGSTMDVVASLTFAGSKGPGGEVYADIPNYSSITPADIASIETMQSGSSQYCVAGATPTPTPTPTPTTKPTTGPMQVTIAEGTKCPAGSPTVVLELDTVGEEAFAYFKTDPRLYVGVMNIFVTNVNTGNDCYGYFVWEMKMWAGIAGTTCPITIPDWEQISRYIGEYPDAKAISPKLLGSGEKQMIGGSFEIPETYRGTYTICLSLWGNHDKQALLDELAAAGYAEEISWGVVK